MPAWSRRWLTLLMMLALVLSGFRADGTVAAPAGKGSQGGATCPVAGGAQVVLDPGHGGADSGAVNTMYSLKEKDLTLDIARQTRDILAANGYSVALTRDGDYGLGNSERGEIANACKALMFVEIHLNGSSDPSVNYSQTFWGKKRKDLAFSQKMSGALSSLGIQNNGTGQFANGGLLQATMPSTLVEAVFLTNNDEGAQLAAGTRHGQIAQAIAAGVMAYT